MEMQFDIASFLLGGAAAILGLHWAKLAGYAAGRIYYRLTNPEPSGWIWTGSMTSSMLALSRDSRAAEARGRMLSGS